MTAELRGAGNFERGISRRDFLEAAGKVVAGVGLERGLLRTAEDDRVESEVRFRFGDHLLSPEDLKESDRIILGETSLGKDLIFWKSENQNVSADFASPDSLESIFRFIGRSNTSSSGRSRQKHLEALAKAKRQGAELVITDEWHSGTISLWKQQEYENIYSLAERRSLTGLILASIGTITAGLYATRQERNPQKLVMDGIKATVGTVPIAGIITALGYLYRGELTSVLEKSGVVPMYAQIVNGLNRFLGSLGDYNKQQLFRLSEIRDASMALNTHFVEESVRQMPNMASDLKRRIEPVDMLFFAATPHAASEELYRKGPWQVSEIVAQHARETIGFTQTKYHQATGIEEKEAALEDWILLTGPYNYPIPTYANRNEFQRGPERYLPLSPRAILWRELLGAALEDPGDRGLQQMGEKLLLEDFAFQYLMSDLYDGYDGIEFSERQAMMDRAKRIGLMKHNYPIVNLFKIYDADPKWELVIFEGVPFLFRIED